MTQSKRGVVALHSPRAVVDRLGRSLHDLRISSDGALHTCLFASRGTDLRGLLREGATDAELSKCGRGTWLQREDRYSERRSACRGPHQKRKIEMHYIGG